MPCASAAVSALARRSRPVRGPACAIFRLAREHAARSWAWAKSMPHSRGSKRLPDSSLVAVPAPGIFLGACPGGPINRIHGRVGGIRCFHDGHIPREHILTVFAVGSLIAEIHASADGRVRISVEDLVVPNLPDEFMRRQARHRAL